MSDSVSTEQIAIIKHAAEEAASTAARAAVDSVHIEMARMQSDSIKGFAKIQNDAAQENKQVLKSIHKLHVDLSKDVAETKEMSIKTAADLNGHCKESEQWRGNAAEQAAVKERIWKARLEMVEKRLDDYEKDKQWAIKKIVGTAIGFLSGGSALWVIVELSKIS